MADAADWEELFARADGSNYSVTTTSNSLAKVNDLLENETPPCNDESKQTGARKKRPRGRERGPPTAPPIYHTYLSDRCSSKLQWPSWMRLTSNFFTTSCQGWSSATNVKCIPNPDELCQDCGHPLSHHLAVVDCPDQDHAPPKSKKKSRQNPHFSARSVCRMVCAVRNARCYALYRITQIKPNDANELRKDDPKRKNERDQTIIQTLEEDWNDFLLEAKLEISSYLDSSSCTQLSQTLQQLYMLEDKVKTIHNKKAATSTRQQLFDACIRIIIACDKVYYQLYYSQVTTEHLSHAIYMVPHPISYFGLLASDRSDEEKLIICLTSKCEEMFQAANISEDQKEDLMSRLGFNRLCNMSSSENALSSLHHFRFLETFRLFSHLGWSSWPSTQQEVLGQLQGITSSGSSAIQSSKGIVEDEEHETPAPRILMEWRDSCRDFLCHLYAYATLSEDTVEKLMKILTDQYHVRSILELGAGTGYLASLLEQHNKKTGIAMELQAFDKYPTSSMPSATSAPRSGHSNEYHGQTPTFFPVQKGDDKPAKRQSQNDKTPRALLLCYPPPHSTFAYRAVKQFSSHGNRHDVVILVGEFRGLTGSSELERLLIHHFHCLNRLPCLSWATDAALVTIWQQRPISARDSSKGSVSLLLPCSNCGSNESIKRCRLLRDLCYCSKTCHDEHKGVRDIRLDLAMIDPAKLELKFDNDAHCCSFDKR